MLISIIIPCYNVENYIEECVESCYTQTYKNIEVICIDNNSTDATLDILQDLKIKHPNLIIDKESKKGAPSTRNKGLSLSKGEWIQFLDADDLLLPNKIEHQVALINENSAFIAGACIKQNTNEHQKKVYPDKRDIYKSLFNTQLGITSSNLWNKNAIDKINGWDENIKSSQEADLMFRLLQQNNQIVFDNKPLTIVRERESGQISQRNPSAKWVLYFNIRIKIINWLETEHPEYYYENQQFYNDSLFGILRILAQSDLNKAYLLFKQHLGKNYNPGVNQNHSTQSYIRLYNWFGFKGAERVRKILTK